MSAEPSIREQLEERERAWLAPQAALAAESKGRREPLEPDSLRTDFQRDRDRIIHSKAFRRLKHKTQVFLAPEGDHYRTRLTHTLEVSQISRSIARALRLNEDLAEAIALGHDLGHTPFGHVGEGALTAALEGIRDRYLTVKVPFLHNEQSLRVVDFIEYDGAGLNLTWEVRDGILNHTGEADPSTLEGCVVKVADRIAYVNHDVDDAMRAGVLAEEDLPSHVIEALGRHQGQRIGTLTRDMVAASEDLSSIRLSPEKAQAMDDLRGFLFKRVYENPFAKAEDPKAIRVLQSLFDYYLANPSQLPADFAPAGDDELPTKVCDYVAGMTDRFAIRTYQALYVPKSWMALPGSI